MVFAVAGIGIVFAGAIWAANRYQGAYTEKNAKLFLNLVATKTQQLVNQTHKILLDLSRAKALQTADRTACNDLLASQLKQYEEYSGFVFADAQGNVVCSAPLTSEPINIGDRLHFKRALGGKFASGEWIVGRLTGETILPFGYPVLNSEGRVAGVVNAGLNLTWLSKWISRVGLSGDMRAWIMDPDGTVLAHYPKPERVGQNASDSEIFDHIMAARAEGKDEDVFNIEGLDGVKRIYAFRTITDPAAFGGLLELYVVAGIR